MKFHLSTLLLAMVIVALGLGWYLDHNDPRWTEIVGTWKEVDTMIISYSSELEIRSDGTFEKLQSAGFGHDVYSGTYRFEEDGSITFRVLSKDNNSKKIPLDCEYNGRFAKDSRGYLIIACQKQLSPFDLNYNECQVLWGTYEQTDGRKSFIWR